MWGCVYFCYHAPFVKALENVLPHPVVEDRRSFFQMEGLTLPSFPRASTPRAQVGKAAVFHSSLLIIIFFPFVLAPLGSIVMAAASEVDLAHERDMNSVPASTNLLQSTAEGTGLPEEYQLSSTPTYQGSRASLATMSLPKLPGKVLSTVSSTTMPGKYSTPASDFFTPTLRPNFTLGGKSRSDYGRNDDIVNTRGFRADASARRYANMESRAVPSVNFSPTLGALSLGREVRLVPSLPRNSRGPLPAQVAFGSFAGRPVSDMRFSSLPSRGTLHTLLPPNVDPALCCRQDRYGQYGVKPWYCSLLCRLMARKIAEKEAARRANWLSATTSWGPRSAASHAGILETKEFNRFAKAVIEASTRSPVVVFTKGHCKYCKDAIKLLQEIGVKRIYVVDLGRAKEMLKLQAVLEKLTGAKTVPRIYIGGVCIGGFSDMVKEHQNGVLKERLEKAAALETGSA